MGYTSTIGEKKAKEIMKWTLVSLKAKTPDIQLPAMEKFVAEGLASKVLLDAYDEFREHINNGDNDKAVRLPYEDSLRMRDFVAIYVPSEIQLEILEQYGMERIRKYIGKL
jgi:hypothetical protein